MFISFMYIITKLIRTVHYALCCAFQVLDEEAEVFIVKMWRLLIYETEAIKIGLVK